MTTQWPINESLGDIREIVSLIPASFAYQVESSGTVSEFQQVFSRRKPYVCVLAILLFDGDGLEVCKQISENKQTAATPIISMSANLMLGDLIADQYYEDFISKPVDINDFPHSCLPHKKKSF